ncbi:MAG: WbqC family protein [Bacteroidales bacterium]|nr:WbqC family protein [Bacteroidales bacterium]
MILSIEYFPTVEFFAIAAQNPTVFLEAFEHYCKQSWRNRCRILSANGPLDLSFPVIHDGSSLITDIRVDYSTPWVRKTQRAISSAYDNSPFFEYYRDSLFALMDERPATLWELDMSLIHYFAGKIGLKTEFLPTSGYEGEDRVIHPKKASDYKPREYWQVFSGKFGFVGGLSVMDLLFNEGPESLCILK